MSTTCGLDNQVLFDCICYTETESFFWHSKDKLLLCQDCFNSFHVNYGHQFIKIESWHTIYRHSRPEVTCNICSKLLILSRPAASCHECIEEWFESREYIENGNETGVNSQY